MLGGERGYQLAKRQRQPGRPHPSLLGGERGYQLAKRQRQPGRPHPSLLGGEQGYQLTELLGTVADEPYSPRSKLRGASLLAVLRGLAA